MAKRVTKPKAPTEKVIALPDPSGIPTPVPISMRDVLGQDRAVETLQSALRSNRIHHAWIFSGPLGVGKCSLALSFAAALLDPTTSSGLDRFVEPEEDSRTQKLLKSGTHPDLQIVVKELARFHHDSKIRARMQTNIPVDVIEDFVIVPATKSANYATSTMSRMHRAFIIDEAELMNDAAQDMLLKTLEEPPPGTVLILVTSHPEKLQPTILSRCQPVRLGLLPTDAMNAWAKKNLADLAAGPERDWLLEFAEGSPGIVVAAREAGIYAWHQSLAPLLALILKGKYTPEFSPAAVQLLDTYSTTWVEQHENASKEAANRAGSKWLFRIISGILRKQLRAAASRGQSLEPSLQAIQLVSDAESQMHSNVQAPAVLDSMGAEIAAAFASPLAKV